MTSIGIERGLIGPREAGAVWDRHIHNSTAIESLVPPAATVIDVGSGAGLPGIPLALVRLDLSVVLLEPLLRRSVFLTEVVEELGLADRVEVRRGRAEEQPDQFDVVTARAVAPLRRLVGWCAPLRKRNGAILAIKGASADEELESATAELRQWRLAGSVVRLGPDAALPTATVIRLVAEATDPT